MRARQIWRAVEKVRPGLGWTFVIILIARIGSMFSPRGRGLIISIGKGGGKGDAIYSTNIPQLRTRITVTGHLAEKWIRSRFVSAEKRGDPMGGLHVTIEDLTVMLDKRRIPENFDMLSNLIYNRTFSSKKFNEFDEEIDDDLGFSFPAVSVVCGGTPHTVHRIQSKAGWPNMWSDRFSVFCPIYDADMMARRRALKREWARDQSRVDLDALIRLVPTWIDDLPKTCGTGALDFSRVQSLASEMFGRQHTEDRSEIYLANDLMGIAALNGRASASMADLEWYSKATVFFEIGSLAPVQSYAVQAAATGCYLSEVYRTVNSWFHSRTDVWKLINNSLKPLDRSGLITLRVNEVNPYQSRLDIGERLSRALKL